MPIALAFITKIEKGIAILRQSGELTPNGEAQYQDFQKQVFESRAAQIDPDPVS